jgi:hypothetical protein
VARPISDFCGDVRARGPYGAPDNVVEDAVRRTAIDLCEQAGVWTYDFTFMQQAGVSDYPLYIPEFTRVVCMDLVTIGKQTFQPFPGQRRCRCGGYDIWMPNPTTIEFTPVPYPACEVDVTVKLWLAPMQEACELPEILWQEYSDTIINGAASRVLSMPKQDYTNQGLSQKLLGMYIVGKTQAKNKRVQQRTTGPLMMRGSYF